MNLITVLENTLSMVRDCLKHLNKENYQKPIDLFSNSSIGRHTRHLIDFLQCLIEQSPSGVVNYGHRKRSQKIEEDPDYTIQKINEIISVLKSESLPKQMILETEYGNNGILRVETSLERELIYIIEHAIHHMAIIKIGLKIVAPELVIPEGFGVAPSTVKFKNRVGLNK